MTDTAETKKRLDPRAKAKANPKSAKIAIAAYCYHTCLGEESGNSHKVKLMVKNCQVDSCPLWPHRPWQKITGGTCGKRPGEIAPDTP